VNCHAFRSQQLNQFFTTTIEPQGNEANGYLLWREFAKKESSSTLCNEPIAAIGANSSTLARNLTASSIGDLMMSDKRAAGLPSSASRHCVSLLM
jgi:hypothetical protein